MVKDMKLGVITDIHNNDTALKVVVERLQQLECDKMPSEYLNEEQMSLGKSRFLFFGGYEV